MKRPKPTMQRTMQRLIKGSLLALVCAACGSAPVHFHTLVAAPEAPAASAKTLAIAVQRVTVPPQVDIPQLILRRSGGTMELLESEQWIGPLPDEIRAALAAQLSARLNAADMTRLRAPEALPLYRVRLDVQRMESQPEKTALIEALWTLQAPHKDSTPLVCSTRAEVAIGEEPTAVVQGYQQALAQIAAQIARAIAKPSASCPAAAKS